MACTEYTISKYLRGKVRNITVPDEAIFSILLDVGVDPNTMFAEVDVKDRDLCVAGLYTWVALSPATSTRVTDKDAHWEHSEGGETMSASVLNNYLRMANSIYRRYNMPTIGGNKWGMVGGGIHNIRNGNNRNL